MDTEVQIKQAKADLRLLMKKKLAGLSASYQAETSAQLCLRMQELDIWKRAKAIMLYASMPGEVDVWPLAAAVLAAGKQLVLPRYVPVRREYEGVEVMDLANDVQVGYYGIREPKPEKMTFSLNRLDLTLVPGGAFDSAGRRLGRGKGFYDRLLASANGVRCAVCWDEQILPQVPTTPHDVLMDCILTPAQWLIAGHGRSANEFSGK